jgi:hypothetical protein
MSCKLVRILSFEVGYLRTHPTSPHRFGSQPQWAICGETYPLGCRFSPHILGSQYFTANPDRRRRLYNTATGLYDPGCGLLNVVMSWSAPEYLYLVLSLNSTRLPQVGAGRVRGRQPAAEEVCVCVVPLLSGRLLIWFLMVYLPQRTASPRYLRTLF